METPSPAVTAIGDAAESLQEQIFAVGTAVLPYAAGLLALTIGWRFARKFLKG